MMMNRNAFLTLLILGIFSSKIVYTDAAQVDLISLITTQLVSLWKTDNVDFLGNSCQYRITPKIRKWKLKHEAKFWCPGWAPFDGRGEGSSRSGAVEKAIRDFANKAVEKNLVDAEDVTLWIQGYNS